MSTAVGAGHQEEVESFFYYCAVNYTKNYIHRAQREENRLDRRHHFRKNIIYIFSFDDGLSLIGATDAQL